MYKWAANKNKLERAMKIVADPKDEEAVKKEYMNLGGLMLDKKAKKEAKEPKEL